MAPTASTPWSGRMTREFDAVGLAGAAYVCDDAHAAAAALTHASRTLLRSATVIEVHSPVEPQTNTPSAPSATESVGIGLDLREVDCTGLVERCEYGWDESGEFDHGMGFHKFF